MCALRIFVYSREKMKKDLVKTFFLISGRLTCGKTDSPGENNLDTKKYVFKGKYVCLFFQPGSYCGNGDSGKVGLLQLSI